MTYAQQTWVNGSGGATPLNATRLNHMEGGIAAAAVPHLATDGTNLLSADVWNAAQSVPNAAWTKVLDYPNQDITSPDLALASNGDEITVSAAGLYQVGFEVDWAVNATGTRGVMVESGSAGMYGRMYREFMSASLLTATGGWLNRMSATTTLWFGDVPDAVYISVFQDSGSALAITYGEMWILRIY
jgi:hypothetical protein